MELKELKELYFNLAHFYSGCKVSIEEFSDRISVIYIKTGSTNVDAIILPTSLVNEITTIIKGEHKVSRNYYFDFRECLVFLDNTFIMTLHEKITGKYYLVLIRSWSGADIIRTFLESVRCGRKYYAITISF